MSGMLPGVELARRRRVSHHHQIGHKLPARRMDLNACHPLGATVGETSLDENTLQAKRRLEERLWNLKPSCKRRWSKFFYHGDRATTDERLSETRQSEPTPWTTLENFRPGIISSQVNAERDVCCACLDGFHLQRTVIQLRCFHECIRSASALS